MTVLLTGASGFVGRALLQAMQAKRQMVRPVFRSEADAAEIAGSVVIPDLSSETDLSVQLQDVDVVIHAAARAHIMRDEVLDPLVEYRRVNVAGTLHLARQAAAAGVKRFVFISSIKVNGESTNGRAPYDETQPAQPEDAYGLSKHEAEQGLQALCGELGMELVIIRPPLVYGPGVKANFASLMRLCRKPVPLPFGCINNSRSMVYLGNLVDFILCCATHPAAANQLFLVSDRQDLSLRELISGLRKAMGSAPKLLPVPVELFRLAGRLAGKQAVIERLVGDLQVDASKTQELLGWQPPSTVEQGLAATVAVLPTAELSNRALRLLRVLDVTFALCGLVFGLPVLVAIYLLGLFDTGSPLFLQERVGRNKKPFTLVKFRTMKVDTASVASHLASSASITRMGGFLRKTKLDELPQLWNVLKGEMSLVGPRPNLYNQDELIVERDACGVYAVRPGITGLAQVNEIDMSTPKLLAETDQRMIESLTVRDYFRYIVMTVAGKGSGDRVR